MNARLFLAMLRRELRGSGSRALFFIGCLAVGVAAIVLVAGLSDGVEQAIRLQGRPLLAADVAVSGRRAISDDFDAVTERFPDVLRADVQEFPTMTSVPAADGQPGSSVLVELKAVSEGYPFYGELVTEPDAPLMTLLGADGAVVEPALLARLELEVGETLLLGGEAFTVRGTVTSEPDRVEVAFAAGPRVFLSQEGLARSGLTTMGGRIKHRALFKAPSTERTDALVAWMNAEIADNIWYRIETWSDGQQSIRRGLERTEIFLGLVALLSLLVGGVGVAQTIRAWLASRLDNIAVLRCLGMTPLEVTGLYLAQTVLLALIGSGVGALVGTASLVAGPLLLEGLLPVEAISPLQPAAVARGLLLGVGVALLFAALPLLRIRQVPPLRVIRRSVEPLPAPRFAAALAVAQLGAGVWLIAAFQSRSVMIGGLFAASAAGCAAVLLAASAGLSRLVSGRSRGLRPWWLRHGVTALARPGAATRAAMVALGLGVMVVLATALIQRRLDAQLTDQLPEDAPSAFLLDVQPDQWAAVEELVAGAGGAGVRSAPMIVARISEIDGEATADRIEGLDPNDRWALSREQRLTSMPALPADNTLLDGALWQQEGVDEISLERRFAERLGVGLGSTLVFDVQGIPVEMTVTSIRAVDWASFNMNFFLIAEPGVLDDAPQVRLVTFQIPAEAETPLRDALAARMPNITLISVRDLLERAGGLLGQLGLGVQLVGGFTSLAGLFILASSISASTLRRSREIALRKTIGASRASTIAVLAIEYALIGAVAGGVGAGGAALLAGLVTTQVMQLSWSPQPAVLTAGVLVSIALVVGAGLAGNLRALRTPPAASLRGE
jgi:putative ABC transport system permease protein